VQRALSLRFPALTPREGEVAARVKAGLSARQFSAELGIAETTVISHRKSAYARMGITGLRDLVRLWRGVVWTTGRRPSPRGTDRVHSRKNGKLRFKRRKWGDQ
jgi:DNA-binding CsgD family transcriptional regulator